MNPLDLVRPEIRTLHPYTIEQTSARVRMDANENPFNPPTEIMEEILEEFRRTHLNRYPDPHARALKEQICQGLSLDPDQIMLGNGSDELLSYMMTTFTGQGKGILFPTPTFSMYGIIAKTLGQRVIEVPLDQGFQIDPALFIKTIQDRSPQIIFLASPNNPTGNRFSEETILKILETSKGLVVVDEAYIDFSDHQGFLSYLEAYPNLILFRTLSKVGMAALRIGILIAGREILAELEKVRLPYNISTLSQAAATVVLRHPEILRAQIGTIIEEREKLFETMSRIKGLRLFPSQANFILFRTETAGELYKSLLERGILIRNLDHPGLLQGCLRVTVGRPEENLEFLEQLERFAQEG